MKKDQSKHKRVSDTFSGPFERPALKWLASHMPEWVTPDILSGVGFFASFLIFAGYGLTQISHNYLWLASFGFALNWFGDSLDGTLARYRKIERPHYGFFLDHTLDALTDVLVFLGLGVSPYVRFDIACLGLISYLLISIMVFVNTIVNGEFRISNGKFGPTEFRVIAILANTLIYFVGNTQIPIYRLTFSLFDMVVLGVSILLFVFYITVGIQIARDLARKEPAQSKAKIHRSR